MDADDSDRGPPSRQEGPKDPDESVAHIDKDVEARALWKVDYHILPMAFLYYLFSFLDRSNIGNGRLYGLEEDLGLRNNQFQIATSIFFVTYVSSEIPATIFLKKLRPARFLNSCAVLWGIIATLTGLNQNYGGFIACRLLLGLAEGPFFPCMVVYMISFYTRKEIATRLGYLISGAAVAGAVGGIIAYGVGHMDRLHGLRAWRWLLILEGLPSICLGVFGFFYLADSPETARYLTIAERQTIIGRRTRDEPEASVPSAQVLSRSDVIAAVKDWKTYAFIIENFAGDIQLFSYSIFLPTIIEAINPAWSSLTVQALTIPCFATAAIAYFTFAYISDRLQHRASFAISGFLISIAGQIMLVAGQSVAVQYFGCFVIAAGLFMTAIAIAWMSSNQPRYGKRSTAVGMQIAIGNSAGVPSPFLYPTSDGPRYTMGHCVTIALLALGVVALSTLWLSMTRTNKRRAAGKEDHKMLGKSEAEVDELGDESPRFRFVT